MFCCLVLGVKMRTFTKTFTKICKSRPMKSAYLSQFLQIDIIANFRGGRENLRKIVRVIWFWAILKQFFSLMLHNHINFLSLPKLEYSKDLFTTGLVLTMSHCKGRIANEQAIQQVGIWEVMDKLVSKPPPEFVHRRSKSGDFGILGFQILDCKWHGQNDVQIWKWVYIMQFHYDKLKSTIQLVNKNVLLHT